MPTNEERREVARKLRYIGEHGGPEWGTAACCIAECIGEDNYPLWGGSSPLFTKLAYLIEPEPERTCENMSDFQDCDCFICSECGEAFETARLEYDDDLFYSLNDAVHEDYYDRCGCDLNYCPNCGAKVVENEVTPNP